MPEMKLIRLQKYLSGCGIASRRHAETLILQGKVAVNGQIVTQMGTRINPEADAVTVGGKKTTPQIKKYILFHKPRGILCSMKDPFGRKALSEILQGITERVYHVGRLDKESEGLLILTNDGDFANKIIHPKERIPKTYRVTIAGKLSEKDTLSLRKGIFLDGRRTLPAYISVKKDIPGKQVLEITITEGRNRQIRNMLAQKKVKVKKLKRIQIGGLQLGRLAPGQYMLLSQSSAFRVFQKKAKKT